MKILGNIGITKLIDLIASKFAPKDSPELTGTPTAPTPESGDNSTQVATTEFVNSKAGEYLPLSGGTMNGYIDFLPNIGSNQSGRFIVSKAGIRGTVPEQDTYFTIFIARDESSTNSNSALCRYATLEAVARPNGSTNILMAAHKNIADVNETAVLEVGFDASGNKYTSVPGKVTVDGGTGTVVGNLSGNATTASYPQGFTSRSTGIWSGTGVPSDANFVTRWDGSNSCSMCFMEKSGQLHVAIDGWFYQNEGKYRCLDTSGGTITGRLTKAGVSCGWNKGRDNALIALTSVNEYSPTTTTKTANGSWEIGAYNHADFQNQLIYTYITDTDYNGTNKVTSQLRFTPENGIILGSGGTTNMSKIQYNSATACLEIITA